ncbi:MAG: RES domain-containing protein [Hyphomicrobiales bacterium]|nr:RES domain-containing protein [Hyphomicrobiales bacterium]MBV9052445.1 RES domain-containing protein [Hyphomicrobiales bacterium]MBV9975223.1 RES domain-containing protein [Hyphomicrobiales bacterium]
MTPLPGVLGGKELVAWRLDQAPYAPAWDSGEGAFRCGGRWNSAGVRAVYCSIDPATAILEMAVHKTFKALDTVPHVITEMGITEPSKAHPIFPADIPNANWLTPGIPSAGQQAFGDALLRTHQFIIIPSAVSRESWNLIFIKARTVGAYSCKSQKQFALDTRLHPPTPARAP